MPDSKILVSRSYYQGLGLGLETWWPRSWSWSRDLVAKVLVLVSRPGGKGLGLGLETWWPRSWSWSRTFFKGLDNKSAKTGCRTKNNAYSALRKISAQKSVFAVNSSGC